MNKFTLLLISISFGLSAQEHIDNKADLCTELRDMRADDSKYRKLDILKTGFGHKNSYPKHEKDSVWKLQRKLDVKNTKRLLELTKKYGWLSNTSVGCKKLDIWLIFRHSDKPFFSEIFEVIEVEHDAKRLRNFEYKMIKDQISGRPKG